mgnify:CR=1 FL=1
MMKRSIGMYQSPQRDGLLLDDGSVSWAIQPKGQVSSGEFAEGVLDLEGVHPMGLDLGAVDNDIGIEHGYLP